ncbi:MAG: hypothetical protein AAFR61_14945 [Bacteroidota bacterium]
MKIKQRERAQVYMVRAYEPEFVPAMDEIIRLYFGKDPEKRVEIYQSAMAYPAGPLAKLKLRPRKRKRIPKDPPEES